MRINIKRPAIVITALAIGLLLCYGVFVERYLIQVNTYDAHFHNLPAEFNGFKILIVTDLHYGTLMPEFWVRRVLEKANGAGADLIVCLGDYVRKRNTGADLRAVWPMLKKLRSPHGVYFVNGNHDHWADEDLALKLLRDSGGSLRHTHAFVRKGASSIAVAGCGDFYEDFSGADTALRDVPEKTFRIALAHNPDTADLPRGARVDLFLCGHTHGGQVIIPFIGRSIMLPVLNKNYNYGLKTGLHNEKIFISRGIGWAIFPIRLNCRPELAIVRLLRE